MEERAARRELWEWLRFAHIPGASLCDKHRLLSRSASPGRSLKALDCDRQALASAAAWAAKGIDWLAQSGDHHIITLADTRYPSRLRAVSGCPLVLYVAGHAPALSEPQVAVVGSRNPTPSGQRHAARFARGLANCGLTVTSGLALGVDAAAHRGALESGGSSLAVCGTGLDRVYPRRNRDLARQITERGALVSEFPVTTPPRRAHFPQRNRVISGLSLGTLVVEATLKSGSLITARIAGDQGREVFAIPGSIDSPQSRGCHRLIQQGARLVECVGDIIEELAAGLAPFTNTGAASVGAAATREPCCPLLQHVGFEPVSVDELVARSGLTADRVSSMLLTLEVDGHVAACPGGHYVRLRSEGD